MALELTAALVVALAVGNSKLVHRRAASRGEPFPNVPDAPASAEPIAGVRLYGEGIGGYASPATRPAEDRTASERPSRD